MQCLWCSKLVLEGNLCGLWADLLWDSWLICLPWQWAKWQELEDTLCDVFRICRQYASMLVVLKYCKQQQLFLQTLHLNLVLSQVCVRDWPIGRQGIQGPTEMHIFLWVLQQLSLLLQDWSFCSGIQYLAVMLVSVSVSFVDAMQRKSLAGCLETHWHKTLKNPSPMLKYLFCCGIFAICIRMGWLSDVEHDPLYQSHWSPSCWWFMS